MGFGLSENEKAYYEARFGRDKKELEDYVDEFAGLLKERLIEKRKEYGDEWRLRGIWSSPKGTIQLWHQTTRFKEWIAEKYTQWLNHTEGVPKLMSDPADKFATFPWIDVAGEALICWVRENKTGWEIQDERDSK